MPQKIVEHPFEALHLFADEHPEAVVKLGIVPPLGQQLEKGLHGDERIADLVDDLRHEAAESREPIESGHGIVHQAEAIDGELRRHRLRKLVGHLGQDRERVRSQQTSDAFGIDQDHGGGLSPETRDRRRRSDALGGKSLQLEVVGRVGQDLDAPRPDKGLEEFAGRLDSHCHVGGERGDYLGSSLRIVDPRDGGRDPVLTQQSPQRTHQQRLTLDTDPVPRRIRRQEHRVEQRRLGCPSAVGRSLRIVAPVERSGRKRATARTRARVSPHVGGVTDLARRCQRRRVGKT